MFRLLSAAACAVLGAVFYVAVVHVPALQAADVRTLEGFMGLITLPGASHSHALVTLFNPASFALLALSLVAVAFLTGRRRPAAVALLTMLGAGVTTQILKPLLAVQREFPVWHYMGPEAYPSGHTTAVMSFALALIIVTPARWRPLATAAGGLLTVATTFAILVFGGHYPSDIVGGLLVATGWACLASAAFKLELRPTVLGPALAAAVLAGAALVAVAWRPADAFAYAVSNTTFVVGALAIAAGALVLSGSVPAPIGARRQARSPRAPG